MVPKHNAEVLPRDPEHKKAAGCLREKIQVLGKLHSGMGYRVAVREFNIKEATIYIK